MRFCLVFIMNGASAFLSAWFPKKRLCGFRLCCGGCGVQLPFHSSLWKVYETHANIFTWFNTHTTKIEFPRNL